MGSAAARIEEKLKRAFAPLRIEVVDESARHRGHAGARAEGESHFRVTIVSERFAGLSRVQRQRQVYDALAAELAAGVHALALTTLTPAEAERRG